MEHSDSCILGLLNYSATHSITAQQMENTGFV